MLVTIYGAAGFIGRNLAKRLIVQGDEVQAIDPANEGLGDAVSPCLPVSLSPCLHPGAVVFLAQSPYYRQLPQMAWHLLAVNVGAAVQAAQQALAVGATRFIYASSGSVYAPGFGPLAESGPLRRDDWYAISKVQAEEALTLLARADAGACARGLDLTIVRPFCVFGPGQTNMLVPNLLDSILAGRPIHVEPSAADPSDRDGLRISPCYIDDAVEILCTMIRRGDMGVPPMSSSAEETHGRGATAAPFAAVSSPGCTAAHNAAVAPTPRPQDGHPTPETVNLAGPEVISIRQLATDLGRLAGKTPNIEISQRCRQGNLIADLTLLRQTYEPRFTSLQTALERTVGAKPFGEGQL